MFMYPSVLSSCHDLDWSFRLLPLTLSCNLFSTSFFYSPVYMDPTSEQFTDNLEVLMPLHLKLNCILNS